MHEQAQGDRQGVSQHWRVDPMVIAVSALGITQITAWGTSYYCPGQANRRRDRLGHDHGLFRFSVALLVMGFISTWVGRLIDRIGARAVMSIGTIIVSAGLLALSQVRDPPAISHSEMQVGADNANN